MILSQFLLASERASLMIQIQPRNWRTYEGILLVEVAIEASACKPCASLVAFEDDSDEDEAFMQNAEMSNYVSLFGDGHLLEVM
ncbi:hypothetical protein Tco_1306060 [Tanacetum coccineum]